jgi:molybdopterin synthase catalytic subunit
LKAVFFLSAMHVKVISFGMLKDWLGSGAALIELEEGATVADLMRKLVADPLRGSRLELQLAGIAVGVNAEYATATRVLRDGDEVALLPPVSGGKDGPDLSFISAPGIQSAVGLYRTPIESAEIIEAIKRGEDGAVVVFDGIVRNNSRGRATLYLDYEAYEEMADRKMREIASEACARFGVRQVVMVHRLGRLEIGETSVLIVVASAHRAQAFDACRWLIDTLKRIVPIWKKETFADGAVWAPGEPFPAELQIPAAEAKHES